GNVNEIRFAARARNGSVRPGASRRASMPGHRSLDGALDGSVAARATTTRSSARIAWHSPHCARCASICCRSLAVSSSSRYSESLSVHWSAIAHALTQMPPENHARAVKLRFRGSGGNAEQRSNLVMFVPLDVVQHEDLARAVGQLLERRLEIHGQIR